MKYHSFNDRGILLRGFYLAFRYLKEIFMRLV